MPEKAVVKEDHETGKLMVMYQDIEVCYSMYPANAQKYCNALNRVIERVHNGQT